MHASGTIIGCESKQHRIDSATLARIWSQTVYLLARLDRIITAGEHMEKRKYETLFWVETIRERIESQRAPNRVFIPGVEIPLRYQRMPDDATTDEQSEQSETEILRLTDCISWMGVIYKYLPILHTEGVNNTQVIGATTI